MTQQKDTINNGLNALFGGKPAPSEEPKEETRPQVIIRGHGRPRKELSGNAIGNEMKTSLIVDREKYDKIRMIAILEGLTMKEVIDSAFGLAVERYESKHGPIASETNRTSKEKLFK